MEIEQLRDEELAAYIDGCLSNEEEERVSALLGSDASALNEYLLAAKATALHDSRAEIPFSAKDHSRHILTVGGAAASVATFINSECAFLGEGNENNFAENDSSVFPDDSMWANNNFINSKNMEYNIIGEENPIQQHGDATCAIKSQQIILQEFGIPVTEEELVRFSEENGLFDGTGTSPEDVGVLLNQGGIPTTTSVNANIFDLTNELAQGHKVIVGVDSGELWDNGIAEWWEDLWGDSGADHALIVAGIDNTDPSNPQVMLTDPGSGELCKKYPLDQFMDAWQDSHCMMVSTDISPVDFSNQQLQYDEPAMHLSSVGGNSYGDFQLFHDMAGALPDMNTWDYANNGIHPMGSLVDAYVDYAREGSSLQTVMGDNYPFVQYIDSHAFVTEYLETLHDNIEAMLNNPLFSHSDITNWIEENPDADALQGYFESQAAYFEDLGEHALSDFFEQQIHVNQLCQDFNINPMDIYTHI